MAKIPELEIPWTYEDEVSGDYMKSRYSDRKALGDEAISKRKAFEKMTPDNPFYQRAGVSAELAQMRWDMSYIVAENLKLRDMISTISWLHEQVSILQGAYAHQKMLAERCRIDYGLIEAGLRQIIKLKEELENGITKGSIGVAGQESQVLQGKGQ